MPTDRRHEAYTAFQRQCEATFDQGRRVMQEITPPRPKDVAWLIAQNEAYRNNLERCMQLQFDLATIAGPDVRKAVDEMNLLFNVQADMMQSAAHLLGEPEDRKQRRQVEAVFQELVTQRGRLEEAWLGAINRFAVAAGRELGMT